MMWTTFSSYRSWVVVLLVLPVVLSHSTSDLEHEEELTVTWNGTLRTSSVANAAVYNDETLGPYQAHQWMLDGVMERCTNNDTIYVEMWELAVTSPASENDTDDWKRPALCVLLSDKEYTVERSLVYDENQGIMQPTAAAQLNASCETTSYRQLLLPVSRSPLSKWSITLLNFFPLKVTRYALRARCMPRTELMTPTGATKLPCPEPILGLGLCSGNGDCTKSGCRCRKQWVDYGCSRARLPALQPGVPQKVAVQPNFLPSATGNYQGAFFTLQVPEDATALVVEMEWLRSPTPSDPNPSRRGRPYLYAVPASDLAGGSDSSDSVAGSTEATSALSASNSPQLNPAMFASSAEGWQYSQDWMRTTSSKQSVAFYGKVQRGQALKGDDMFAPKVVAPLDKGLYYVGVVNRQGSSSSLVQVTFHLQFNNAPLCGFKCSGNGVCVSRSSGGHRNDGDDTDDTGFACLCGKGNLGFRGQYCQYPQTSFFLRTYVKHLLPLTPAPQPLLPGEALYYVITKSRRLWFMSSASLYIYFERQDSTSIYVITDQGYATGPHIDDIVGNDDGNNLVVTPSKPLKLGEASSMLRDTAMGNSVVISVVQDGTQLAAVQLFINMPPPALRPKLEVVGIYVAVAMIAPLLLFSVVCLRARRAARIEALQAQMQGNPRPRGFLRPRHFLAAVRPMPLHDALAPAWQPHHAGRRGVLQGVPKDIIMTFPQIVYEGPDSVKMHGVVEEGGGVEVIAGGAAGGSGMVLEGKDVDGKGKGKEVDGVKEGMGAAGVAVDIGGKDQGGEAGVVLGGEGGEARLVAEGGAVAGGSRDKEDREGDGASEAAPACPICLHEYQRGDLLLQLTPCCHIFHSTCIGDWLQHHSTCPICRNDLLDSSPPTPPFPAFPPPEPSNPSSTSSTPPAPSTSDPAPPSNPSTTTTTTTTTPPSTNPAAPPAASSSGSASPPPQAPPPSSVELTQRPATSTSS